MFLTPILRLMLTCEICRNWWLNNKEVNINICISFHLICYYILLVITLFPPPPLLSPTHIKVCSNGHILLIPKLNYPVKQYLTPKKLYTLNKYPIVAAFWTKMSILRPYHNFNKVQYGQTTNGYVRKKVKQIVNDDHFNPHMVVWAKYIKMRPKIGTQVWPGRRSTGNGSKQRNIWCCVCVC